MKYKLNRYKRNRVKGLPSTILRKQKSGAGFSIIELIVAVAIFVTVSVGAIGALVGSMSLSRLAKEEGIATQLAEQGVAAIRSIRDQGWGTMMPGTYGLVNTAGVWSLSGTSDTTGKYTREVEIVQIDADNMEAISRVSWNFTPSRNNQVELTTYLTNWQSSTVVVDPTSCAEVCASLSYSTGTCRKNKNACTSVGETNETTGDVFCTGGKNADTCCCEPVPTPTPTPTPTPSSCTDVCVNNALTTGTCRKNSNTCSQNGETYFSSGNIFCTGGKNADTCCCAP